MAISEEFLMELRARLDIESVVSPYVNLRHRGKTLVGLCPFHNEKTPSFTVYPESQSFYCFGCNAGGEIITFLRRIENLDFVESVKSLAQRAGMQMPEDGYDDTLSRRRAEILSANREAARFFHQTLMSPQGHEAYRYLIDRGYTPETIKHFGLGFAPPGWDGLLRHMRAQNFDIPLLREANLLLRSDKGKSENYFDNFRNRIMIPIIDLRGNVIAFGGRVMDDSVPKYINTSDTPVYKKSRAVFALNFAKNGNEGKLILAEGYMDVIALHQAGFTNAVAGLGTALTGEQAQLMARYAQEIILAYDNDEAGQKATRRAIEILGKTGMKIRVLTLRGGKDPDDIIKKHGRERFQSLLDGAANDTEFKMSAERAKHNIDTTDGRLNYLKAAAGILAEVDSPIEVDLYASNLASEFGVEKSAILGQVTEYAEKTARGRRREEFKTVRQASLGIGDKVNPEKSRSLRAAKAEEILISSLLNNPDYYKKLREKVQPENFVTEFYKRIFALLYERLEAGKEIEPTVLAAHLSADEMSRVTKLLLMRKSISNTMEECLDCIRILGEVRQIMESPPPDKASEDEFLQLFDDLKKRKSPSEKK